MKSALLTFALFVTVLSFGQDGYKLSPEAYQEITDKLSKLDTTLARALAERLAGSSATEFAYMQTKTTDKATKYYFTRTDLTEKEQKDQDEMGCSKCLVFYFRNNTAGLDFWQVAGSFEELQPMWQSEFLEDATADNAKESFRYREVKDRATGTDIRFAKQQGMWQIYNWMK